MALNLVSSAMAGHLGFGDDGNHIGFPFPGNLEIVKNPLDYLSDIYFS